MGARGRAERPDARPATAGVGAGDRRPGGGAPARRRGRRRGDGLCDDPSLAAARGRAGRVAAGRPRQGRRVDVRPRRTPRWILDYLADGVRIERPRLLPIDAVAAALGGRTFVERVPLRPIAPTGSSRRSGTGRRPSWTRVFAPPSRRGHSSARTPSGASSNACGPTWNPERGTRPTGIFGKPLRSTGPSDSSSPSRASPGNGAGDSLTRGCAASRAGSPP